MQVAKISDYIVKWLSNYAGKAGVKGFVVGVSGGIDSAVTSTLCAKTGLSVFLINMPIKQEKSQIDRAQIHIDNLCENYQNTQAININLTPIFENFSAVVPTSNDTALQHLSLANTRARLRMTTLYYLAGIYGCLVAGTGNKIEDFGVGFFTKYGDGGVDISPIADLVKSEVFALGRFFNVTQEILNAPPTDGLFGDDRTDEDQLGASYDELEWAMRQYDLHKKTTDFSGRERTIFEIYTDLHEKNKHKMEAIPVCLIPKNIR